MDSSISPKQQEIQEREKQILAVSRSFLAEQGYHGLSMDRIAEALSYSKGTIYNHFGCKEEIIIALAIETMEARIELFSRAVKFQGCPREKFQAIGVASELFFQLHPLHYCIEQIMRSSSIWEKTSEHRRTLFRSLEHRTLDIVVGIILEAIELGDLKLPEHFTPVDLVFGAWAQTSGAFSIITTNDSLEELGIHNPLSIITYNGNMMLDGFGWKPLLKDFDLDELIEQIKQEVFFDEYNREGVQ